MVFYEITELGRGLEVHLRTLTQWSRDHRDAIYAARSFYDGRDDLSTSKT